MSDHWTQDGLLRRGVRTARILSLAALLVSPAWAQSRGHSGNPPAGAPRNNPAYHPQRPVYHARPIGPAQPAARPLPGSPFARPPVPALVPPRPVIPPAAADRLSFMRLPPLQSGPLPKPAPGGTPYCSPLSAMYNTGSICFNPNLFTIRRAFRPVAPYVPPPVFTAVDGPISSFIPPALLLQYCATCAIQRAGLPPPNAVGGVKQPPISPPVAPSRPPMILVLKNGTMPLVGRYWLGSDWLIHYVTVDGLPGAVPSDMLNLKATGEINFQRGSVFSLPGWPTP